MASVVFPASQYRKVPTPRKEGMGTHARDLMMGIPKPKLIRSFGSSAFKEIDT